MLSVDVAYTKLAHSQDFLTRAKLRGEIRKKVERIDVHFNVTKLKIRWHGPAINPACVAVVRFVNGAVRVLMLDKTRDFYGIAEPKH